MDSAAVSAKRIGRREPAKIMRLARLGSLHQSRLSFMRILTRRMQNESWTFSRPVFEIDNHGVGYAVYSAHTPENTYSLVAFAHDLPAEKRSDRVIAEAWDSTFTLFDGIPDADDIARLSKNIPLQEAGRVSEKELSVSRANRSVRLWEHVVDFLASGVQPDKDRVASVGYLMRTTAVYGSGKLGAADWEILGDRPEFSAPFQVEMLSVYLTRAYVRDLVQHMANIKGGSKTVELDPEIARSMGIGNSTGLGMAPFILNHPVLLNNWIMAREEAIARCRSVKTASKLETNTFAEMLTRSSVSVQQWHTEHPVQLEKLTALCRDLTLLENQFESMDMNTDYPWDTLYRWSEDNLSIEGQECLASLLMEPYGELIDELAPAMSDTNASTFNIQGAMQLSNLKERLREIYGWAITVDWSEKTNSARTWYISEEKLEPRLGERFDEPVSEYEQPLAPARDAVSLFRSLDSWQGGDTVAEFLLKHPDHRHTVRRVQIVSQYPYAEILDNTISAELMPVDMLRCKLAFFGATHFDPRSDRWVRICMYANAPYPEELANRNADYWPFPEIGDSIL